ncbi:hypothetical protein H9P43_002556 [Blastocladiella emersonii ATCC 22665]|nr:hypothetical protein H9P43_002556 [Blastocladiella emersonii ATCC 22665]
MSGVQCTSSACTALLNYVVPALGNLTAVLTCLAPLPAVRRFRVAQNLGTVNPVPYAFLYINALIWIQYGIFIRDIFVVGPNLVGVLLAAWYMRSAYGLATPQQRKLMDSISSTGALTVFLVATVSSIWLSPDAGRLALGVTSVIILGLFYSSPLSVLATVLRTRDASPFDVPLAVTCLVNGSLWIVYGIVLADPFIWAPNIAGAAFAVVQLVARAVLPARVQAEIVLSDEESMHKKSTGHGDESATTSAGGETRPAVHRSDSDEFSQGSPNDTPLMAGFRR